MLYSELSAEIMQSHTLIINTTPLGMEPHPEGIPPLDFTALGNEHVVYDLVYKPAETLLMKTAKAHGASTYNGLRMLQLQAEAAWELFKSNTV
jgi:shikimate dehydrogenase